MKEVKQMKKLFYILSVVMLVMFGCLQPTAHAEFPERPVGLVVLDYGRNVDRVFYKQIYQPVKWAYHFPYYKILEDDSIIKSVADAIDGQKAKVTPELMQSLAEQNKVDVLVVARIYDTSEVTVPSFGGFYNDYHETYTRVTCFADLHCYNKDKNKLLTKRLRDRFVTDNNAYEKPQDTVKWQLSKLVNTMEGRPIIGGDK